MTFVDGVIDRLQFLTGRRGFGAGPNGARGGGGGGGGRFRTIDFPASLVGLDTLGDYAIAIDGGGGGKGGDPGREVSIVSGADIRLFDPQAGVVDLEFFRRLFASAGTELPELPDRGKVRVDGGDGGNGLPDGRLTVATNNPIAKAILDLIP